MPKLEPFKHNDKNLSAYNSGSLSGPRPTAQVKVSVNKKNTTMLVDPALHGGMPRLIEKEKSNQHEVSATASD